MQAICIKENKRPCLSLDTLDSPTMLFRQSIGQQVWNAS